MKKYSKLPRQERIKIINSQKRKDLVLILENLTEDQNISAILRTAESFGVKQVYIVYIENKKPRLSMNVSSGAIKWLEIKFFNSILDCYNQVKSEGYKIYGAVVDPEAEALWYTKLKNKRVAIVVGNEAQGLTKLALDNSDKNVYLPMFGLTESLNVSVSAALFLYEIIRQKEID